MSEGVDKDAVRAWAGALSAGLGLVRFSDLPKPVFDRLLSSAAYQGRELHVVIAENATLEGLDELALEFCEDTAVMEAVAKRRKELMGRANVVAFPTAGSANGNVPIPEVERKSSSRLSRFAVRFLGVFDEQPTEFDGPAPQDEPAIEPQRDAT